MSITAAMVKELREKTGIGMMDCKKALEEANGDMQKAIEILRKRGIATAEKKASRSTKEGVIYSYIHANNKIGVLIELNCETDFVAKSEEFILLAKDLCMHIAAMNPPYKSREDVPPEVIEREKDIFRNQLKDSKKPENIIEKIIEGKMEKFYKENCLMDQAFIKDESLSIKNLINKYISKFGENITLSRYIRYQVGA